MYYNKFVLYVTVNGKVLREHDKDNVLMPFGTEYSICLKNLNSRLAVAKISVDGEDVLDGNEIIVHPNQVVKLEGFMKNQTAKNKFKFIEKTLEIENYRGNRPDDGIIKVDVRFQKEIENNNYYIYYQHNPYHSPRNPLYGDTFYNANISPNQSYSRSRGSSTGALFSPQEYSIDDGITVKGSEINQEFSSSYVSNLEDVVHTLVLRIQGYKNNKKVKNVFLTKDRITCYICGKNNVSGSKYCSNCGNFLD